MNGEEEVFARVTVSGERTNVLRPLADETPVALEFNGFGYAVLMASAADLPDLAYGFALAERLIDRADQLRDVDLHRTPEGVLMRINLEQQRVPLILQRVRHRVSESSCGLCGIENLEQALRPLPRLTCRSAAGPDAVFAALAGLAARQPMNAATGAVHAAALCDKRGEIQLVREDVGRHNAFDKLVGAMLRAGQGWDDGFALLTSRCSFEIVEKAVLAGCPMLATISAPTTLAVRRAREGGLALTVLARPDALLMSPGGDLGA